MKYIRTNSIAVFLYLLIGAGMTSCTKYVTLAPPATQIEGAAVFENEQAVKAAISGLYSRMTQTDLTLLNGGATLYPALSADELYNTTANSDYDPFLMNSLVVNNGTGIVTLWKSAYQSIYQVNSILEGLAHATSLPDSVVKQVRGEMLVNRALNFFYLINLFGDVPYTATTDYRVNQSLARTPVDSIYQQIIADLTEAKVLKGITYPSVDKARPNKWTASALLARVYLYRKDYANAEAEATSVIQSGQYSLVNFPQNPFAITSAETIWQLPRPTSNTADAVAFLPFSATTKPPFAITSSLLAVFEAADKRKANWLGKTTVSGTDYYYPFKYKINVLTPVTEYLVVFRLAEQYLIRAEARAMQQNVTGAKADIDLIRNRAGLIPSTATAPAELLAAIEKERRTELFAEWGHRWLDVIRWGRADAVFGPLKSPNWQPTDIRYPLPLIEMQNNPFLVQNPGY